MVEVYTESTPSNKGKIVFIIVIAILVILIIGFFIIRMIVKDSMTKKGYEMYKTTLISTIYNGLDNIKNENISKTNDPQDMKNHLNLNKNIIETQINNLKTMGESEIYDYSANMTCDNGTIFSNIAQSEIFKICNNESFLPRRDNNYKVDYTSKKLLKVKPETAFITIAANSLLISMTESMIDSYENSISSKKDYNILTSEMLSVLDDLAKQILLWQILQPPITNISYNNQSLLHKDIKNVMINLDNYNNNYKAPTEQEINSINLKAKCLELFNLMKRRNFESSYSGIEKSIPSNIFLFISPNINKVCQNLEKTKKDLAIKMLKRTQTEKNSFIAIKDKIYLNLLVKCTDEWFLSYDPTPTSCMNIQKNQLVDNLIAELNKP